MKNWYLRVIGLLRYLFVWGKAIKSEDENIFERGGAFITFSSTIKLGGGNSDMSLSYTIRR